METLKINIMSRERADAAFLRAVKGSLSGKRVPATTGTYFTSLGAVRAVLTDKRMALLHLIRERHPKSVRELAKFAGRDFKNVHTDVTLLKRCGLLGKGNSEQVTKLEVPYRSISIHATV